MNAAGESNDNQRKPWRQFLMKEIFSELTGENVERLAVMNDDLTERDRDEIGSKDIILMKILLKKGLAERNYPFCKSFADHLKDIGRKDLADNLETRVAETAKLHRSQSVPSKPQDAGPSPTEVYPSPSSMPALQVGRLTGPVHSNRGRGPDGNASFPVFGSRPGSARVNMPHSSTHSLPGHIRSASGSSLDETSLKQFETSVTPEKTIQEQMIPDLGIQIRVPPSSSPPQAIQQYVWGPPASSPAGATEPPHLTTPQARTSDTSNNRYQEILAEALAGTDVEADSPDWGGWSWEEAGPQLKLPVKSPETVRPRVQQSEVTSSISPSAIDKPSSLTGVSTNGLSQQNLPSTNGNHILSPEAGSTTNARIELRKYQKELAAPGLEGQNSIICAPTGSGKTYTAGHIIYQRRRLAKELKFPFKALFIVCIRNLVKQQADQLKEIFPSNEDGMIAPITETNFLAQQIIKSDIVVLTAQILVNCLRSNEVNIQSFHLLVMDECHHTNLRHPYNEIMHFYRKKKREGAMNLPQVIGLTASLGVGQNDQPMSHYIAMCANLNCSCITHVKDPTNKEELLKYNPKPKKDQIVEVDPRDMNDAFCTIIHNIMAELEEGIGASPTFAHGTQQYENWVVQKRTDAEETAQDDKLLACLALRELNTSLLIYRDLQGRDALAYLDQYFRKDDLPEKDKMRPLQRLAVDLYNRHRLELQMLANKESLPQNQMLFHLHRLLKALFTTNQNAQGIVLTRTLNNVEGLLRFVSGEADLRGEAMVRADKLVGQGRREGAMTDTQQEEVIRRFREGRVNLLVATDVAQEGLNIAKCNFVVRYNFVSNEIGTTQSKGRARAINSECYLIVEKSSINLTREYQNLEREHQMMEALDDIDKVHPEELEKLIDRCQRSLWEEHCKAQDRKKAMSSLVDPANVTIHCRYCKTRYCSGLDMRKVGSNYICVAEDFKDLVTVRRMPNARDFRFDQQEGHLICGNQSCGQRVGIKILYKTGPRLDGYALGKEGVMWKYGEESSFRPIKKWSMVPFAVEEEELGFFPELPPKSPKAASP